MALPFPDAAAADLDAAARQPLLAPHPADDSHFYASTATTDPEHFPADPARLERRRRRRMAYWSLVIPFTFAVAMSMISAPQSQFILRLICREEYGRELSSTAFGGSLADIPEPPMEYCKLPSVQKTITITSTLLSMCATLPTLLVTAVNGRLSDNPAIGRKPFLLIPLLAESINILVFTTVATLNLPSAYLALGYFVMGWSGGFSTFMMAYFAFVSESVPVARRTYLFTLVEGALLAGFTVGPILMSLIVRAAPSLPLLVFGVAAAVVVVALAQVLLIVQRAPSKASTTATGSLVSSSSSASTRSHSPYSSAAAAPVHPSAAPASDTTSTTSLPSASSLPTRARASLARQLAAFTILYQPYNRTRLLLVACSFLIAAGMTSHAVAFIPYTYRKFGWTAKEDGVFQSFSFLWKLVAIAGFLPFAYRRNRGRKVDGEEGEEVTLLAGEGGGVGRKAVTSSLAALNEFDGDEEDDAEDLSAATTIGDGTAGSSSSTPASPDRTAAPAPAGIKPGSPMEARVVRVGFFAYVLTFLGFAFATEGWMFILAAPFDAIGVLAMPLMRSLLTQTVAPEHQGTLLGVNSTVGSLASIVAPLAFTAVYAQTVGWMDGAVYLAGAGCWAAAFGLSLFTQRKDIRPID
ncbi:hypothetical protein H9P43_006870 [Blastocladiella emersonii ATCC 22665]|nr:hypothetical protein H9P43_006870 [Blastocladiella emersonii ATCC 22665]